MVPRRRVFVGHFRGRAQGPDDVCYLRDMISDFLVPVVQFLQLRFDPLLNAIVNDLARPSLDLDEQRPEGRGEGIDA